MTNNKLNPDNNDAVGSDSSPQIPNRRRHALAGLASGALGVTQLPTTWVKPVINSVVLPAHAQTSSTTTAAPTTPSPPPTTPSPLCTDPVVINATFSEIGTVFAIGDNCDQINDGTQFGFYVDSYQPEPSPPSAPMEIQIGVRLDGGRIPVNVPVTGTVVENFTIRSADRRVWTGDLTFSYNGSAVIVTGTMNLA